MKCTFEEFVIKTRVVDVINSFGVGGSASPFFIWYSSRMAHTPLQAPDVYKQLILDQCGPLANTSFRGTCNISERSNYLAMIKLFDDMVGEVIAALKQRGLYENTVIVFQADNGGPIGQGTGGNNFPLRGGKSSPWEGGYRVPAFVSGGVVPNRLRGTSYNRSTIIRYQNLYCKF
jgi:arylsulfatase B